MSCSIECAGYSVLGYLCLNTSINEQQAQVELSVPNLVQVVSYLKSRNVEIYEKSFQQKPKELNQRITVYSLCDLNSPQGMCVDEAAMLDCLHEGDCNNVG